MILPFITELTIEPADNTEETTGLGSISGNKDSLLSVNKIFSLKFQSMMNNMEENTPGSENNKDREIKPDTELSFSEKYDLVLKRIEKERFERELLAGNR